MPFQDLNPCPIVRPNYKLNCVWCTVELKVTGNLECRIKFYREKKPRHFFYTIEYPYPPTNSAYPEREEYLIHIHISWRVGSIILQQKTEKLNILFIYSILNFRLPQKYHTKNGKTDSGSLNKKDCRPQWVGTPSTDPLLTTASRR